MIPFRKILFPVDYSEPCRQVVPYVKEMTERFSAELIILRAFEAPPVSMVDMGYENAASSTFVPPIDLESIEQGRLAKFVDSNFGDPEIRTRLVVGDAAHVIGAVAKEEIVDLIMMPTRGAGAFRRLLLGSVTGKVLHDADCAVWTDTHEALETHKPTVPYQSIVCALGLNDESRAILHGAGAIAKAYGAALHIVHSVETPPTSYEVDFGPFRKELIETADAQIKKLRAEAEVDATVTIGSGAVAEVVRAESERHRADLVVTGRGLAQTRVSRVWSALYGIVRESPCPVLSI